MVDGITEFDGHESGANPDGDDRRPDVLGSTCHKDLNTTEQLN